MGLGLSALVVSLSAPVEATLWGVEWERLGLRSAVARVPGPLLVTALVFAWVLGARLFGRALDRRLDEPAEPRLWFRSLRALVVGFPGLGVGSLPLWRRLAARRSPWAYRQEPGSEPGGTKGRGFRARVLAWFDPPEQRAFGIWLFGIASLLLAMVWLAAPRDPDLTRRLILTSVAGSLHVLGFCGTLAYLLADRPRGASRARLLFVVCWVLPLPFGLGAFGALMLDPMRKREETLTWTAYARVNQPGRLPRWAELERSMSAAWRSSPVWVRWSRPLGRTSRPELTTLDRRLLFLGAVKVSLLLADGTALGWLLLRLGGPDLGLLPAAGWVLGTVAVVVGGGLTVVLGGFLAGALRLIQAPRPLGGLRRLWNGSGAVGSLGCGLLVGAALARGDRHEAGVILICGALLVVLVLGFGMILQVPFAVAGRRGFDLRVAWPLTCLALIVVGGLVAIQPSVAVGFVLVALASPLVHGLFWLMSRPELARSLDPGGDEPTRLPRWVDCTAALPLGGLVVAWWYRLRDHRLVISGGGR